MHVDYYDRIVHETGRGNGWKKEMLKDFVMKIKEYDEEKGWSSFIKKLVEKEQFNIKMNRAIGNKASCYVPFPEKEYFHLEPKNSSKTAFENFCTIVMRDE